MNALLDAHQLLQGRWDMIVLQVLVFWIYLPAASCYILYESMIKGSETDEISDKRTQQKLWGKSCVAGFPCSI